MTLVLRRPAIYLVTPGEATPDNYVQEEGRILRLVASAVEHGFDLVQLREKHLTDALVYELTTQAAVLTRPSDTKFLVNDRADIAAAAGADGVHLTSTSVPTRDVRKAFGDAFVIGVSTHSVVETLAARNDGADFALFGPVFATPGKPQEQGIHALSTVCSAADSFPVIAVGGIDKENASSVIEAGAAGIAAIRALDSNQNIATFVKRFRGI